MQFNFVVSSNESAVHLWQSLGFEVVGRLPGAFRHPRLGLVDALVMFPEAVSEARAACVVCSAPVRLLGQAALSDARDGAPRAHWPAAVALRSPLVKRPLLPSRN